MGFGRKGLAAGATAPEMAGGPGRTAPASAEPSDAEIAARREAFVAAERARNKGVSQPRDELANLRNFRSHDYPSARPARPLPEEPVGPSGMTARQEEEIRLAARGMARNQAPPRSARSGGSQEGSVGTPRKYVFGDPQKRKIEIAYIIWFFIGQTGLHRVYCGQAESAAWQVGLLVTSIVTLLIFAPIGLVLLLGWMGWIVGDLFMMPSMLRKFQQENDCSGVFA